MLRSVRVEKPAIRALVAKVSMEGGGVLLNSGAMHILRSPKSEDEWNKAKDIVVQTAAGDRTTNSRRATRQQS